MSWLRKVWTQPWWVAISAVGGLLVSIAIAGLVGLWLNERVDRRTDEARYDVELEAQVDDLRLAIFDLRLDHRDIAVEGPSEDALDEWEAANVALREEIDELEEVEVRVPELPQPDEFRLLADDYREGFRSAAEVHDSDPEEFERASGRSLDTLYRIEDEALEIDALADELAVEALDGVDRATVTSRFALAAVLVGLFLAGAALAYAVLRVVAELRRLYARQRALSEELARASRAKSDFLADVSHEIRTPLTVIRGNAETGLAIQRDCAHGEILEEIARETRKTSRMVGDLLFLARSDSAEPPLEKENVATELFLAELSGRAAILARERGATLEIEHEGCEWVRIDPTRVEQSVLILIDNAAKYGGAPITLTSRNTSGELIIEVSDDGPGIPEEKLPHIFERFYRADRTRRRNGAGLGLPIAKTIIEAHGGRIEVESEVGEGTTMSLYLPLMDDEDPANHLTASNTERSPD